VISSVAITQAPQRAAVRVEGEDGLRHAARMQDRTAGSGFAGARPPSKRRHPGCIGASARRRIGQYRPVLRVW